MWAVFGYFLRYPKAGVVMVKHWLSICCKTIAGYQVKNIPTKFGASRILLNHLKSVVYKNSTRF